jgi:hypothetical protein
MSLLQSLLASGHACASTPRAEAAPPCAGAARRLVFDGPCDPGNPWAGAEGRADGLQDGAIETGTRVGRGAVSPVETKRLLRPAVRLTAENWQARSAKALVSAGFGFVWYSRVPSRIRPPACSQGPHRRARASMVPHEPIVNQWSLTNSFDGPYDRGNPCAEAPAGAEGRAGRGLTSQRGGLAEVVDRKIKTGSARTPWFRPGLGSFGIRAPNRSPSGRPLSGVAHANKGFGGSA